MDDSLIGRRFVVLLLTTFAGLALLLAALGLYGVISYSVRLRTRELGVRMALGAPRSRVLQMVLLQGARLAAIGLIAGIVLAAALGASVLQLAVSGRNVPGAAVAGGDHNIGCGGAAGDVSAGEAGGVHRAHAGAEDGVKGSCTLPVVRCPWPWPLATTQPMLATDS